MKPDAPELWITWESQRRNRELSRRLGVPLLELAAVDRIPNPVRKYLSGALWTLKHLMRVAPRRVWCQNPSLALSLLVLVYARIRGAFLVVDAHNAGLFPLEGRVPLLNAVSRLVQRGADLTLVTNGTLAGQVAANGGRPFVLPDPIPHLNGFERERLAGQANLLFICTYAMDEPYAEVFEAARGLPPEVRIYVSGNYAKRGIDPSALAPNIVLTGYLAEEAYLRLLHSVDATIDLTTRENCLVCGAYESMAAGKPMVLSKTRALQTFFSAGAVYTDNSAADIRRCIEKVLADRERLAAEITHLRQTRMAEWEQRRRELLARVRGAA